MATAENMLSILEREFPGEKAWQNFVSTCQSDQVSVSNFENCNKDVSIVLMYQLQKSERVLSWLSNPVPALGGQTPKDVLAKYPIGQEIVKSLLMRMH